MQLNVLFDDLSHFCICCNDVNWLHAVRNERERVLPSPISYKWMVNWKSFLRNNNKWWIHSKRLTRQRGNSKIENFFRRKIIHQTQHYLWCKPIRMAKLLLSGCIRCRRRPCRRQYYDYIIVRSRMNSTCINSVVHAKLEEKLFQTLQNSSTLNLLHLLKYVDWHPWIFMFPLSASPSLLSTIPPRFSLHCCISLSL